MFLPFIPLNISEKENNPLNLNVKGDPILLMALDNNTGDFIPFTYTGNPDYYDDSNYLYVNHDSQDYEIRESYSTYNLFDIEDLTNISLDYKFRCENLYSVVNPTEYNASFYITYVNGSKTYIYNRTWYNWGFNNYIDEGTQYFEPSQTDQISNFTLYLYTRTYNIFGTTYHNILRAYLWNLRFEGLLPEIANITYDTVIKQSEMSVFSADIYNFDSSKDVNITYQYLDTSNNLENEMESSWTSNSLYFDEISFSINGNYRFFIQALNAWNNFTLSDWIYFSVGDYPQSSYLSLFSSLDGFPLKAQNYKTYLGFDEEQSLVNFRTYYGNWTQIYATSNMTATFIDDYIEFNATNNGLKTLMEDGQIFDTQIYNTLLFNAKFSQNSKIVIIYNPEFYEKDYHIDINSTEEDVWLNISIPFFYFNQYQNVTNDLLAEIGFWITNGSVQLSNIRIAQHYLKSWQIEGSSYLEPTISEVSNATSTVQNYSSTINYLTEDVLTYKNYNVTTGYNNSFASWDNIEIQSNDSITLNQSIINHYAGNQSFYGQTGDPTDWYIYEYSGTNIYVNESVLDHKDVLMFDDPIAIGSSSYCRGNYQFSNENTVDGMIEFMVLFEKYGQYDQIHISEDNGGAPANKGIIFFFNWANTWTYQDASKDIKFANGTTWFRPLNTWMYLRVGFNLTNGWNCSISYDNGTTYHTGYDRLTGNSSFPYYNNPANFSHFSVLTSGFQQSSIGLDSLDFSTDLEWYPYRFQKYRQITGNYTSDVVDFGEIREMNIIQMNITEEGNQFDLYITDNSTGSFDNWMNYYEYYGNSTQFLKYRIDMTNYNSTNLSIFNDISFFTINYSVYSISIPIGYFNGTYDSIYGSWNTFNVVSNVSNAQLSLGIWNFNTSSYYWLNHSSIVSSSNYTLNILNNTVYNSSKMDGFHNQIFYIYVNSSKAINISIHFYNLTTEYNLTLYSGSYIVENDEYIQIQLFYNNENYTNCDFKYNNGTDWILIEDLDNSTSWERIFLDLRDIDETIEQFGIFFYIHSPEGNPYSLFPNGSISIREFVLIKYSSYRLLSIENRQNPENMVFDTSLETLAITDFFDNVLYREEHNYRSFIDVSLPIATLTVYNWLSEPLLVEVQRGLGVAIEIIVAPQSSISIRIFASSYTLFVRNLELNEILIEDFSIDQASNIIFEIGTESGFYTPTLLDLLINFFFGSVFGILMFILFVAVLIIIVVDFVNSVYNWYRTRKEREKSNKRRKNTNKRKRMESQASEYTKFLTILEE